MRPHRPYVSQKPDTPKRRAGREKQARFIARLRERGLTPITLLVPAPLVPDVRLFCQWLVEHPGHDLQAFMFRDTRTGRERIGLDSEGRKMMADWMWRRVTTGAPHVKAHLHNRTTGQWTEVRL